MVFSTLQIRGKWQSARENCESALALDPRNVEAIFELGLLYNSRGVHADNLIAKVSFFKI